MRNRWNRTLFYVIFLGVIIGVIIGSAGAQTDEGRNFPRYNFNVGGTFGIGRGDTGSFVGNSFAGVAGAGVNFSRLFGISAEYMYYDLDFRPSVAREQSLGTASGSLNAFSLNGIIRPPFHVGPYSAYGILGVGFYDRNTYSNVGALSVGALCQPSWRWWDVYCFDGVVPETPTQTLGSYTKVAGGYNFGGGLTYSMNHFHHAKVYAEFRIHHPYFSDSAMGAWPITVGLRW
ncbi:MAG: hypothetical protein WCB53_05980 [Terriglobales bacterium]